MRITAALALTIFVAAAVVLLATVPTLYVVANHNARSARSAIADACAAELSSRPPSADVIGALRRKYGVASIVISSGAARQPRSDVERRAIPSGVLEVRFADDPVPTALRAVRFAATAAAVAGVAALVLLMAGIASVTRRGERDRPHLAPTSSSGRGSYLFETFEMSIRTMKGRESELRRLHDREKERADELAIVTGTLVRSLTSGFIAIDESGKLLDLNQTARELLGISPDAPVAGRAVAEALGESPFARALAKAADERATLQREEIAQDVYESSVIGLTTVPLTGADARYFGLLALFTDLTPVRRLESRVREMQSLADLGEMSAGIAHEFRNSLATVLGYLRLARKEPLPHAAEQRLHNAEDEAKSLNEAVEKLLAFSRPIALQPQPVELRELVDSVVERFRGLHPDIDFDVTGQPVDVAADAALLTRAFENIVRNAVEAIAEKANGRGRVTVTIRTRPAPQVTVEDNGVGIDEADVARLLLPFQSRKVKGHGLGLALVRKIVLLHGGRLRLTGVVGQGATVVVEFPGPPE